MQMFKMTTNKTPSSDPAPNDLAIGVINPYALVEALAGRQIDWNSADSAQIISDTLQTDYDELFDMKHDSVLYAGLKLNSKDNTAKRLSAQDMRTLAEEDMETPALSKIEKVDDLHGVGLKDIGQTRVKQAWIQNGKLNLVLSPHLLGAKLSNEAVTESISTLVTPFRRSSKEEWTPPNSSWRHLGDFDGVTECNDPVQGAVANCWLIAALSAVAWADPYAVVHHTRAAAKGENHHHRVSAIHLYGKGGRNGGHTQKVEVTDDIIINDSTKSEVYCRSSGMGELWPSLYEKAFAKWITRDSSDHPDITQTAFGDPVKAMAQLNDKKPYYYYTSGRSADDILCLVRTNCVSFRTINPIIAWTYGSSNIYKGSNVVGNHAYTVLGWAGQGDKQYLVLRNPFGVTEPMGLNTYPGLLSFFDSSFWRPLKMVDKNGVFALEPPAFKEYFAGLGIAK
jgi:hypothetical protein